MDRRPSPRHRAHQSGPPLPPQEARPQPERRRTGNGSLRSAGLTAQQCWSLLVLLVLPVWAACRMTGQLTAWWLPLAWAAGLSAATWMRVRNDKLCAVQGKWRTPEATLHFMELLGGWPASYLAQRRYRHKIVKVSYQVTFWCIVALHQAAAADCLTGWSMTRSVRRWLGA
jgi:uncharacterized membrane protein YsdA (DUF1294 family)